MSLDQEALATLRGGAARPAAVTASGWARWRGWVLGVALLLALGGWFLQGSLRPLEVEVVAAGAPGAGEGTAVLNASGYVVARQLATVSSKVTGQVRTLTFEEGGSVAAGQVLATLDDSMARAALEVAARQRTAARSGLAEVEVRLAEATRERDRLRRLRESGLVSESALDAAEAQAAALAARLETARAELAVATSAVRLREQELEELVIRAPFDGVDHLEGRPARRDDLADLGRRRLHAHRHRDAGRHGLARDRGRCQRGLHQSRARPGSGSRPCSMRTRTGASRRT
jgi:multidrug efflux pump subunit AcrA (membrane-fusion protein)